jgi:hypothetical protein
MIKRMYFIALQKYHNDGSGSFAYNSGWVVHSSWWPEPIKAFTTGKKELEVPMKGKGNVHILAFNRV